MATLGRCRSPFDRAEIGTGSRIYRSSGRRAPGLGTMKYSSPNGAR